MLGARRQMCVPLSGSAGVMSRRSLSQNSGYFLPKPMVVGRIDQLGVAERRQHRFVEPSAGFKIAHGDGDVVDHVSPPSFPAQHRCGPPKSIAHLRDRASRSYARSHAGAPAFTSL